jgi:hypothetical protein
MDAFLERALPEVLQKCREAKPPVVADFVRLVELHQKTAPPNHSTPEVIWLDNLDGVVENDEIDEAA